MQKSQTTMAQNGKSQAIINNNNNNNNNKYTVDIKECLLN